MRRKRRIAAAVTAAGVVVAGGLTAFTLLATSAKAENVTQCEASTGTGDGCTLETTVAPPGQLVLVVTVNSGGSVQSLLTWNDTCTNAAGASASESGYVTSNTIQYTYPTVGVSNSNSCDVYAQVHVDLDSATQTATMVLESNPGTSAAPSPTTTSTPTPSLDQVRGYAGTCITDAYDSSAARSKVEIWTCSAEHAAEGWTYSGDELKIHGDMCINAKGNGKSGSKLLLWPCNGGPNEIWIHKSNGEYVLKANGYKLCLDDPAYSKKNGTQLAVYACNDGGNQRWTLP